MSLTSLLKLRDVRERFNAEFAKPKIALARGETFVVPSKTKHWGLIGTAFDYLARVHVTSINRSVWSGGWIAEDAVDRLELALAMGRPVFVPGQERSTRGLLPKARSIVKDARTEFEKCVDAGEISSRMLNSALLLAQLDTYFRCGLFGGAFGKTDEADVADLRGLLAVLRSSPDNHFVASRVCVLNPSFGEASSMVGGADADLIVDDTLIELKTTKDLEFSADSFWQLMGYYVLAQIGGLPKGIRPKPAIRNIAMYSARYGVFAKISVDSMINAKTFPEFVRWFVRRAKYGHTGRPATLVCDDGTRVSF